MKRVSLKDIAKLVGVSPSTVSFVLNGKAKQMRISEALAEKISEVARQQGYHPNQVAVSLRTGKSHMLGMVVESMSGDFFASFARIIEEEVTKHGYKAVYCSTDNNRQKGQELIRMLQHQQVDGYIITPSPGMEQDIQELVNNKKPVVLVDSYFPGIDAPHVLADNVGGVRKGMDHLVERGYRRIGFVTVDLDLIQVKQRKEAYTYSLTTYGIDPDPSLILMIGYQEPRETIIERISNFIKDHKDLQAIFFATNYLGLMGLESIHRLDIRMPDELAMISFDDHDVFRLSRPGVTSIQQPVEEIARTAIRLLMEQLGKTEPDTKENKILLPANLVVRGTT